MQAIILAAGIGSRISKYIGNKPKCLIEVCGKTLLERQVDFLSKVGVGEFILCLGYKSEDVKNFVKKKFSDKKFVFVQNNNYLKTNAIYSLWLSKDFVKSNVFVVHSDIIFDDSIFELVKNGGTNWALVHKTKKSEKDFNSLIENSCIKKIEVNIPDDSARFTMPFYKVSKAFFYDWMNNVSLLLKDGETNCYAEKALTPTLKSFCLKPLYFETDSLMEIDNLDDLQKARGLFEDACEHYSD